MEMETDAVDQILVLEENGHSEESPPPVEKSALNGELKEVSESSRKCSKRQQQQAPTKEAPQAAPAGTLMSGSGKVKKEDRTVETVRRKIAATAASPQEKLEMLFEKYSELYEEYRKGVVVVKQGERRMCQVQREKEQLQADHSKVVLTRSRLESLCRELQRQNKAVKDESLGRIREEEEKRKELSARFNVTLNEITALMQQNTEKNNKLRDENKELTDKFKTLCDQYELREQQVEKMFQQNILETKLSETKLAKAKVEMIEEKELLLKEVTGLQTQLTAMQNTEAALRSQIVMYSEKYDEFQSALAKSNEIFSNFKCEMEKMSKKICILEKDTQGWKVRWERSQATLIEMMADKQQREEQIATQARQMTQLQRLCRSLQEGRAKLAARLKELGEDVGKPNEDETSETKERTPEPVPEPSSTSEFPTTKSAEIPTENLSTKPPVNGEKSSNDKKKSVTPKVPEPAAASSVSKDQSNKDLVLMDPMTVIPCPDQSEAVDKTTDQSETMARTNNPSEMSDKNKSQSEESSVLTEPPGGKMKENPPSINGTGDLQKGDKRSEDQSESTSDAVSQPESLSTVPENKKKSKDGGRKKKK